MTYGIRSAVAEMVQIQAIERMRRLRRERLSRAIKAADAMLDRLERFRLQDRSRLPWGAEGQLKPALMLIPIEIRPRLQAREPIQTLMDDLYRAQDVLLAERSGSRWH